MLIWEHVWWAAGPGQGTAKHRAGAHALDRAKHRTRARTCTRAQHAHARTVEDEYNALYQHETVQRRILMSSTCAVPARAWGQYT